MMNSISSGIFNFFSDLTISLARTDPSGLELAQIRISAAREMGNWLVSYLVCNMSASGPT